MGVFLYLRRGGINSVIVGILGANSPTIYIIGITAFLFFIFYFPKKIMINLVLTKHAQTELVLNFMSDLSSSVQK